MAKQLDHIDDQIIRILRDNARIPIVTLAKRIGLSRSATQERLGRLEKNGTIAGYTIRFSQAEAAEMRLWMFIKFQPGFLCAQVVPEIMKHTEIRLCNSLSGQPDLIVMAQVSEHGDMIRLREAIALIPGIAEVQTAPVLKAHFDARTGEVSDIVHRTRL